MRAKFLDAFPWKSRPDSSQRVYLGNHRAEARFGSVHQCKQCHKDAVRLSDLAGLILALKTFYLKIGQ